LNQAELAHFGKYEILIVVNYVTISF